MKKTDHEEESREVVKSFLLNVKKYSISKGLANDNCYMALSPSGKYIRYEDVKSFLKGRKIS